MEVENPQSSGTGMGYRKQQKQYICQALGCDCDLSGMQLYHQRKHLCEVHIQAECVRLHNTKQLFRFCFQCGKLEDLQSFDGNKRTCRARLQKRRNRFNSQKQKTSLKPATPGSRRSSLSSISDAAAAAAKAGPHTEQASLSGNACSWDLQVSLVGGAAAALEEPAAAVPDCSAHQAAHRCAEWQQQQQPVEAAGSSGSSGSSGSPCTTGPWDTPYAAAASPMASSDTQCTGSQGSSLLAGTQQLTPSNTSAPTSSLCWGSPAAAAGFEPPLPPLPEDLMPSCLDDAASLQIVLESELTAAALGAAIMTSSSRQQEALQVDADSRRLSQSLSAVLVQDSGLFGEPYPGAAYACTAGVMGLSDSSLPPRMLQPQEAMMTQYCLPGGLAPVQQPQTPYSQESVTGSNGEDSWGSVAAVSGTVSAAGMFPPIAAPAAGPVWGYQAMCPGGLQAPPLMSYGFAVPACSSTAGPLGSMGAAAPAQFPAGQAMHYSSPGVFAAACGGQLPLAAPAAAPVNVEPGLPMTTMLLGPAGVVGSDGKAERLHQLQQEMCHLHHCVEALRCQLGL